MSHPFTRRNSIYLLDLLKAQFRINTSAKLLFLLCALGIISISLLVLNSNSYCDIEQCYNYSLLQEALENSAADHRYAEIYRKSSRLPNDTKYILLWTRADYAPFYYMEKGQKGFIKNNCSVINCFVTDDRNFFGGDLTKFHAIAFNGRNLNDKSSLPKMRAPHQKYIFFNMESADNYPVCRESYDDFFNWTSTYRLDSDIPYPYILIKNKDGQVVGPKRHMNWERNMILDESIVDMFRNKSKAAAWFVSHCASRSGRLNFVKELQGALKSYNYKVDIYGSCGTLKCPINKKSDCDNILSDTYFFYMAMENSFAEDYVTEKLLTAVQHNAIPIVYGGADYTRFLPPGSYIDARSMTVYGLASTMAQLASDLDVYKRYFAWKSYYSYHDPKTSENVCALCKALNNEEMFIKTTVYRDFRRWWNPEFVERCKRKTRK